MPMHTLHLPRIVLALCLSLALVPVARGAETMILRDKTFLLKRENAFRYLKLKKCYVTVGALVQNPPTCPAPSGARQGDPCTCPAPPGAGLPYYNGRVS